jgi:hypothetical protein
MTGSAVWFFALLPGSYGACCSGAGSRRTEDKKTEDRRQEDRRQKSEDRIRHQFAVRLAVANRTVNSGVFVFAFTVS